MHKELADKFIRSCIPTNKTLNSIEDLQHWVEKRRNDINVKISTCDLNQLSDWTLDETTGSIRHKTGKFYSIDGISVKTNYGIKSNWDQPIINQPEIGILGIITKEFDGVLHFLMQTKVEPGNINIVQISPTLQATRSNYTKIHKGKSPQYLEYFREYKHASVLIDQFQSEQGARFLKKRNRNIIIECNNNIEVPVYDDYKWMTLFQIYELMKFDNLVNMDTRTVISSVSYYLNSTETWLKYKNINFSNKSNFSLINIKTKLNSTNQILSWVTSNKFKFQLDIIQKDLRELNDWKISDRRINHISEKYFSVIGVSVNISNREVISWNQPMIKPAQQGIIAFIIKKIKDTFHFLVQAKVEAGNFDILELAPTVQCLTGNYRTGKNEYSVPFINEVLNSDEKKVWHKSIQSEEGGRFFHEQNLNMIVEVDENFNESIPDNYCWMTLPQLNEFMRYNNYLNIGARNLISLIPNI